MHRVAKRSPTLFTKSVVHKASRPSISRTLATASKDQTVSDTEPKQNLESGNKKQHSPEAGTESESKVKKMTSAEQDEQLMQKLALLSGDGGAAGVEYENGQPVAMKRSVKNNMFRYI